jgi:signal peptidase I
MLRTGLKSDRLKHIKPIYAKQLAFIVLLVVLCLYLNASPAFMAVASNSMEPTLYRGDMILTSKIDPVNLKKGDIIVFKVPKQFQEQYGYPSSICHRIVNIQTDGRSISINTKGDGAGEDPFMVTPELIKGKQTGVVPVIGYVLLYIRSWPGVIFVAGLNILMLIYWNSTGILKLIHRFNIAFANVFHPESSKSQMLLESRIEQMSIKLSQSEAKLSSAIICYDQRLTSHSNEIKSLAQTTSHLESIVSNREQEE